MRSSPAVDIDRRLTTTCAYLSVGYTFFKRPLALSSLREKGMHIRAPVFLLSLFSAAISSRISLAICIGNRSLFLTANSAVIFLRFLKCKSFRFFTREDISRCNYSVNISDACTNSSSGDSYRRFTRAAEIVPRRCFSKKLKINRTPESCAVEK